MNNELIEQSVKTKSGQLTPDGALIVKTGKSTGRSTKERFIVKHKELESEIDWGSTNQAMTPENAKTFFNALETRLNEQKETYTMNGFVGCFEVSVTSTSPWHIAFAKNMFRENFVSSLKEQIDEDIKISIFHAPEWKMSDLGMDWPFDKAIILDPINKKVGIVGTGYAGEIKKSAFTLCNFLLPQYDILPMHSSANCKVDGSQASVLFGLSGTGKTTLSADASRELIGDDEIIWSKRGLSNIEGGCYAKLINLDPNKEPEIYKAANKQGSILENVCYDDDNQRIDFYDDTITENTRGSYSIESLEHVYNQQKESQHPKSIVFLTADAFGALPAIAKLDSWQTQYHFISGYTAKVAGTEIGIVEPEATFSACFGAPFMPRPSHIYATLLAKLVEEHKVNVWLLNTGWVKGYGNGERFPIDVSRKLLDAIQTNQINLSEMQKHPVFGFNVPTSINGIDSKWLEIPSGEKVFTLAKKFIDNAERNKQSLTEAIVDKGGPKIMQ